MRPKILILHATGTNRDGEAAFACQQAGGDPEIVHVNQLVRRSLQLMDYQMLVLPGGFSYGDDLGAGKLWAVALRHGLGDDLAAFVEAGRPILGICNGFQALVKSGLLPGLNDERRASNDEWQIRPALVGLQHSSSSARPVALRQRVTLARNESARFECRWVYLGAQSTTSCIFTQGLQELIYCPAAHGEGRLVARDAVTLAEVEALGLVAVRYVSEQGEPAGYPWNPNGSQNGIAGLCNPRGNILGLMPHPEDHVLPQQHPRYHRGERGLMGLSLFANGVRYAAGL